MRRVLVVLALVGCAEDPPPPATVKAPAGKPAAMILHVTGMMRGKSGAV